MASTRHSSNAERTRNMVTAALLAAMMAGTSWISIQFGAVPVTLQTTFVLLAGLLLSPGWAAASMGLYLALGAAGLPVFAGGQGGLAAVAGPTGGFLVAFPVAAFAVSLVYRTMKSRDSPWLMKQLGLTLEQALAAAVVPFLVPDAIKAVLAVVVARAVERAQAR